MRVAGNPMDLRNLKSSPVIARIPKNPFLAPKIGDRA
jgi:hypothetical protein